jgi:hypothetical protein
MLKMNINLKLKEKKNDFIISLCDWGDFNERRRACSADVDGRYACRMYTECLFGNPHGYGYSIAHKNMV